MPELSLDQVRQHFQSLPSSAASITEISSYRLASVLILIYPDSQGLQLILTRRTEHLPHHAGQISLPGGSVEENDANYYQTALREANEEIGLVVANVEILNTLEVTLLPSGFAVTPIIGIMDHKPTLQANPGEVAEIIPIPLDTILNTTLYKQDSIIREGIKRSFYFFDYKDNYVWGATAKILRSLAIELSSLDES